MGTEPATENQADAFLTVRPGEADPDRTIITIDTTGQWRTSQPLRITVPGNVVAEVVSNWTEWAVNPPESLTPRQRRRLRKKITPAAEARRRHYVGQHRKSKQSAAALMRDQGTIP